MTAGRLWRHRDFRLLWAGQTVSDLGTAVTTVVLPLVAVVQLRAGALAVGALVAAEWLPWLVIGLPAGAWVDRMRCRGLLIGCDAVRAVAFGSIPVVAAIGALSLGQLYAVALVAGVATVFFQVAYQSYLPTLVDRDDLAEGNAKLQGSQSAASVAGPGLGGLLAQVFRAPFALSTDAASYLVSAAALLAIRTREAARAPVADRSLRREIGEGLRFVWADPLLRLFTVVPALINMASVGAEAIYVLFLVRTVHLGSGAVGLVIGLIGLGSVLGAVLTRPVGRWIGTARAIWLLVPLTALCGLLVPLTAAGPRLAFFLVGNVVMFAGFLIYNVTIVTFRQSYCPAGMLARVTATMRFVLFGTIPIGGLLGGVLAGALGTRTALWVLLATTALADLTYPLSPLRRLRDLPAVPAATAGVHPPVAGHS